MIDWKQGVIKDSAYMPIELCDARSSFSDARGSVSYEYKRRQAEVKFIVGPAGFYDIHNKAMDAIYGFIRDNQVYKMAVRVLQYRYEGEWGYVTIECFVRDGKICLQGG